MGIATPENGSPRCNCGSAAQIGHDTKYIPELHNGYDEHDKQRGDDSRFYKHTT
jgi:hypothetical protein